jgi:hypothetical protein
MFKILSLINLFEDEVPQNQHESFNFEPIIYAGNVTKNNIHECTQNRA